MQIVLCDKWESLAWKWHIWIKIVNTVVGFSPLKLHVGCCSSITVCWNCLDLIPQNREKWLIYPQDSSIWGAAVAQKVKRVAHFPAGRWFDLQLFQSACWTVLQQETEAQIAPNGCITGVWVCVVMCLMSRWTLCWSPLLLVYEYGQTLTCSVEHFDWSKD